jgi:hypothetical protein
MSQPFSQSTGSRLLGWQRLAIYTIGSGVALSGLVWFGLHQMPETEDIFSPWLLAERTTGIIHGLLSLAMLVLFGSMLPVHVRAGWRAKVNFASGASLLLALSVLSLTGGALYYLAGEKMRLVTVWIHEIVGVLGVVLYVLHRGTWRQRV